MRAFLAILLASLAALVPAAAASPDPPVDLPLRPCEGPVDFGCEFQGHYCAVYVEDPYGFYCGTTLTWLGNFVQCVKNPNPTWCLVPNA